MRKKLHNWYILTLSALTSALGFGSCGCQKATVYGPPPEVYGPPVVIEESDSVANSTQRPTPPPVVYGPPPTDYRQQPIIVDEE